MVNYKYIYSLFRINNQGGIVLDKLQRCSFIKNHLYKHGSVSVSDMALVLDVSTMTIRRDIEHLKNIGMVTSTYGGISLREHKHIEHTEMERGFEDMIHKISENSTIYVDSDEFAKYLTNHYKSKNINVFTCNLKIVNILSHCTNIVLYSVPGIFDRHTLSFYGGASVSYLDKLYFHLAILESSGIDRVYGFMTDSVLLGEVKRIVTQNSKKVCIIVKGNGYNENSVMRFTPFCNVQTIGFTSEPSEEIKKILKINDINMMMEKDSANQSTT